MLDARLQRHLVKQEPRAIPSEGRVEEALRIERPRGEEHVEELCHPEVPDVNTNEACGGVLERCHRVGEHPQVDPVEVEHHAPRLIDRGVGAVHPGVEEDGQGSREEDRLTQDERGRPQSHIGVREGRQ